MADTKMCSKCGRTKPVGDFHGDAKAADGHQSQCADCQASRSLDVEAFQRRFGQLGQREIRDFPFDAPLEVRDSGSGQGEWTITGHAAVFNRNSLDLGGFTESIDPRFFDEVMSDPNLSVLSLWDHDTARVLGKTPLTHSIQLDGIGLRFWTKVIPTSYSADLRKLMDARAVDGASFAFNVGDDSWEIRGTGDDETVHRTLLRCGSLFDTTVTALGAYPAATSEAVRGYVRSYAAKRNPSLGWTATADEARARLALPAALPTVVGATPLAAGRSLALAKARVRVRAARLGVKRASVGAAAVVWDEESGVSDLLEDVNELLGMGRFALDVSLALDAALICDYTDGDPDYFVAGLSVADDGTPTLAPEGEWTAAEEAWVAAAVEKNSALAKARAS